MTIEDLQEEAQTFLDYYVLGATAARAQVAFPASNFAGIRFRAPAELGIRPEYEPIPDPADGTFVAAGTDGPEGLGPYLFLDRCPLRTTKATIDGSGTVMIEFIFVVRYPPGRFPDATIDQTVEVRLPSASLNRVAIECLSQFEDAIAFDPSFDMVKSVAILLDKHYLGARYPSALPGGVPAEAYDSEDSARALAIAADVVAFVAARLEDA